MDETESNQITLSEQDISFLQHFIKQYKKSLKKGMVDDSHHDAVAVVLYLQNIFENGTPS